jgi:hypothetical protein
MNSSIYSADRKTHLRIVTVALAVSIAIVGFAISVRVTTLLPAGKAPGQTVGVASEEATIESTVPRRI